jgi:hypothetical protein
MDANTPLWKAHDISQQLQDKIEVLPNVERAFVHVDHEFTHIPVRSSAAPCTYEEQFSYLPRRNIGKLQSHKLSGFRRLRNLCTTVSLSAVLLARLLSGTCYNTTSVPAISTAAPFFLSRKRCIRLMIMKTKHMDGLSKPKSW